MVGYQKPCDIVLSSKVAERNPERQSVGIVSISIILRCDFSELDENGKEMMWSVSQGSVFLLFDLHIFP